jgi:hypothetical protein
MGCFIGNLGAFSVFEVEIFCFIMAMEHVLQLGWRNIWLESDSTSALLTFKNVSLVPTRLKKRWHDCFLTGFQVISSHIFREENSCVDGRANHGHSIQGVWWSITLPDFIQDSFFSDRFGLPKYRFP